MVLGQRYRRENRKTTGSSKDSKQVLANFLTFVNEEHNRDYKSDTELFTNLPPSFPMLRDLTISHIYHWKRGRLENRQLRQLQGHIGVSPLFDGSVDQAAYRILPALENKSKVSNLYIHGIMDPRGIKKYTCP